MVIYDLNPSRIQFVHPSHAMLLSLCTGSYSLEDISYLFRETYNLTSEDASETVLAVTNRLSPTLEFLEEPDHDVQFRYEPREFLYRCDESSLWGADTDNLPGRRPLNFAIGINLNLTFTCNFRCSYCYQAIPDYEIEKLPLQKCLELVEEAADWGVLYFGMTGGEPTLFGGWMVLLEKALSYELMPVLTTNGTIIGRRQEIAQRLYDIGLRNITISLDASYPELHHEITNSVNTFKTVVNSIRYLLESDIRVSVKHVLTPENFDDLGDFIDFAVGLGVYEVGISYKETGAIGSQANRSANITASQLQDARGIVEEKGKIHDDKCRIYKPRNATCTWGDGDWYPCGGLYLGMSICPSGEVTICDKLCGVETFSLGNVFDQSMRDIWNGPTLEAIRDRSIDKSQVGSDCTRCSKLNICGTGCFVDSYNAFGDYFAKHPNCGGPFAG